MSEVYKKLGNLLKLERERQKIELSKISEELKISEENLRSVEEGDLSSLPSELYFKLFAKSYSETLGIDYGKTVEAIQEDLGELPDMEADAKIGGGEEEPDKEKATSKTRKRDEEKEDQEEEPSGSFFKKALYWFIAICAGFAIILVIQFVFLDKAPHETSAGNETVPAVVEEAADDVEGSEANSDLAGFNWDVPSREAPSPLTLKIVAREECWATILSDGDTAVFRNLVPWREYDLEAQYRFLVSIAHPSVVEVTLNDRKVDLRDPESRRISRVRIDQVNAADFPEAGAEAPARVSRPSTPPPQPQPTTQPEVAEPQTPAVEPDTQSVPPDSTGTDTTVSNEEI